MKILNTTDFAKLPESVLFSEYEPNELSKLRIKGTTGYINNLGVASITDVELNEIEANWDKEQLAAGDSSPLALDSYTRDVYSPKTLFAVWEVADLFKLAEIVATALSATEFKL